MRLTLAVATLRRHPARTTLAVLGIAVAAALLLDMVMLATGMSDSFRSLLLTRGYQLRVAPKGTLPFDSEATIDGAGLIVRTLRSSPDIVAVSPVLGGTLSLPSSRVPSPFALGIEPAVQGDYAVEQGSDLPDAADREVVPAVVSRTFLERTGHRLGDMRRLIRQYQRPANTVFPIGPVLTRAGTTYGNDVNFPVPFNETNNPNFTGCLDRNA